MSIDIDYISSKLVSRYVGGNISLLPIVDSTNSELKRSIIAGNIAYGDTVIALEQTKGRGRRGNDWYSPLNESLYMSVCIKPPNELSKTSRLVVASAVAIAHALLPLVKVKIKWPNDIFLNGRKLCGTMSELIEFNGAAYVIVGIGINLYSEQFPGQISDIAISLKQANIDFNVNDLICRILTSLEYYTLRIDDEFPALIDEFCSLSCVIGCNVDVIRTQDTIHGRAIGFDSEGQLVLETADQITIINAGDVHLRCSE